MKYVLDSSVAFKVVVPEANSVKAIRLRDGFRKGIHELIAPDIFPGEVGHALTKAERKAQIMRVFSINAWNLASMGPCAVERFLDVGSFVFPRITEHVQGDTVVDVLLGADAIRRSEKETA